MPVTLIVLEVWIDDPLTLGYVIPARLRPSWRSHETGVLVPDIREIAAPSSLLTHDVDVANLAASCAAIRPVTNPVALPPQ